MRRIVVYAEKLDGKPVTPRERTRQQHEQNIFTWRNTFELVANGD